LRSTSCEFLAQSLLESCIAGNPPQRLPQALLEEPCAKALFGILVEGLGDRFEPALCDIYARLFSQAIPGADLARYDRVRRPRPVALQPRRVLVLSRVTLGADVAVTSVLLAAANRAFPHAEIVFAGPRKNFEMFAADSGFAAFPRLTHAPVEYRRGSLSQRLAVWDELKALAAAPDTLVLDPDSRLTQLGLLPICDEDRYHLFESRRYGGTNDLNLPALAAQWSQETLGVANAAPYVALPPPASCPSPLETVGRTPGSGCPLGQVPLDPPLPSPYIAVSLGVGENPAKRLPDPFESELLALLSTRAPLVIDKGAGGEEAARVERAAALSGATFWEGSFAGFAQVIAGSSLYVGYDSAGQHVAAACGVPLISVFAGFPSLRMFHRWRPSGPRATVIRVDQPDPAEVLAKVAGAIKLG
jgi:ADP-heptose:LPS heptosyltransferase